MGDGVMGGLKGNTCVDERNGNTEAIGGVIDAIRGADLDFTPPVRNLAGFSAL
jgi:hypothetical protein